MHENDNSGSKVALSKLIDVLHNTPPTPVDAAIEGISILQKSERTHDLRAGMTCVGSYKYLDLYLLFKLKYHMTKRLRAFRRNSSVNSDRLIDRVASELFKSRALQVNGARQHEGHLWVHAMWGQQRRQLARG